MPQIVKNETETEDIEIEPTLEESLAEEESPVLEEIQDENQILYPEDLPADTILFEGGPTAGDIVAWKEQYGPVYITEISYDQYVVWRTINRAEYRQMVKEISQLMEKGQIPEVEINMYNEELICQTAVLWPTLSDADLDNMLAGAPSIISQQILECSGFRPIDSRGL